MGFDDGTSLAPFTYIWIIENYPKFNFDCKVFSPKFTVESMGGTEWYVVVYAMYDMDLIEFSLNRSDDSGPQKIEIEFEFSILAADGTPWIEKTNRGTFGKGMCFRVNDFEVTNNFAEIGTEFLPMKTVTIRCRMWRRETNIPQTGLWMARTRLETDCISFIWPIKDFSTLELAEERWRLLKYTMNGFTPCLELGLFFFEHDMWLKIINTNPTRKFHMSWEISLVGVDGKIHTPRKGYGCIELEKSMIFRGVFSMDTLRYHASQFFSYDALCLKCEFEIFVGDLESRIEYQTSGVPDETCTQMDCSTNRLESCCPLKISVKELHDDDSLVDVNFRVDNQVFPAHKVILGAQSLVFKDMFASEIRETRTIDIPNVKSQTFKLLMKYVYTDTLPDLDWESALELHEVANKYKLLGLLCECTSFLRLNSSLSDNSNLEFLNDKDYLHRAVERLYVTQDNEILRSDSWKTFKQENPREALETLERVFIMKFTSI
ncbi:speckle-type POZ protein [Nephila pilipes]|uniref:Speckle-type POZ protein n=1 Tax=Nephila pilipes TaxID=299642 RepID=A0A8X6JB01_NEPPI|nr:speckle-type POZ protein [Nephila pilipes]